MNIGFFSEALPYLPSVGGFRLYGANLIRHLARRHRIDLVSLLPGDDGSHLDWAQRYCASVQTVPFNQTSLARRVVSLASAYAFGKPLHPRREVGRLLADSLTERRWDVIHVEGPYAGGLIDADLPVPKILSAHDCWTLRSREMLSCVRSVRDKWHTRLLSYHQARYERRIFPLFDRCVFVGPQDAAAARESAPEARILVIPNGTDTEYYRPMDMPREPSAILFHGHLGYPPNVEAVLEFANDILPLVRRERPDAIFHIVGAAPHPQISALVSRPGIRLSANLPDLRMAVSAGAVYACPIRHGTGVKNKILEAMAMCVPIVAHPNALVGIDCRAGVHVLTADAPQEFADAILNVLRAPQRAAALAAAARRLVETQYGWESRAHEFERVYEEVVAERRVGTAGLSSLR